MINEISESLSKSNRRSLQGLKGNNIIQFTFLNLSGYEKKKGLQQRGKGNQRNQKRCSYAVLSRVSDTLIPYLRCVGVCLNSLILDSNLFLIRNHKSHFLINRSRIFQSYLDLKVCPEIPIYYSKEHARNSNILDSKRHLTTSCTQEPNKAFLISTQNIQSLHTRYLTHSKC